MQSRLLRNDASVFLNSNCNNFDDEMFLQGRVREGEGETWPNPGSRDKNGPFLGLFLVFGKVSNF